MSDELKEKQLRQNGEDFYPIIKKKSNIDKNSNDAVTSIAVIDYVKKYGSNLMKLDSASADYTISDVVDIVNDLLALFGARSHSTLGERKAFILACSDFQTNSDSTNDKSQNLKNLLTSLNSYLDYNDIDVNCIFVCGDYTGGDTANQSVDGLTQLKDIFKSYNSLHIEDNEFIIVQGNHDRDAINSQPNNFAKFGDNDKDEFGVFVIHENNYPWASQRSSDDMYNATINTANQLREYLEHKRKINYQKPIFILSHLPLHYSMRTYNDGDGRYAKYIFDVLNEYSDYGLDIYFLFGHNHSNGWDNYVGGSRVYIEPGEDIVISNPDNNQKCNTYTCKFTTLNAGYIGYYDTADVNDGSDKVLTISAYEIYEKGVIIKRFDMNGRTSMEGVHVPNTRNDNQEDILDLYDNGND